MIPSLANLTRLEFLYLHNNHLAGTIPRWVQLDFKFMITLSFFHFVFTSIGTNVLMRFNFFEYKAAPVLGVLPVVRGCAHCFTLYARICDLSLM